MKVSLITACYNSEATIEETIRSVVTQDYGDIEYLIIDGKSKDNTLRIADKYKDRIARVVSEKDAGIYDALNKGIAAATGEIIGILHADDSYAAPQVISKIAALFDRTGCDCAYADLQYVDRKDPTKVLRHWHSGQYRQGLFTNGWMPPHPTFFIKKEWYERHGGYTLKLRSAADYELMLRMLHKHRLKAAYLPEVIVKMKAGGMSNASLLNRIKANREDKLAWKMNDLKPGALTFLFKPLSKIGQYFRKRS